MPVKEVRELPAVSSLFPLFPKQRRDDWGGFLLVLYIITFEAQVFRAVVVVVVVVVAVAVAVVVVVVVVDLPRLA